MYMSPMGHRAIMTLMGRPKPSGIIITLLVHSDVPLILMKRARICSSKVPSPHIKATTCISRVVMVTGTAMMLYRVCVQLHIFNGILLSSLMFPACERAEIWVKYSALAYPEI